MGTARFIALEALLLVVAAGVGGPSWTTVAAVACVGHLAAGFRSDSLAPAVPALAWLTASALTGNRELFFPYAMHLAAAAFLAAGHWPLGAVASGTVIAAFIAVRVVESATLRVLAVELAAAVAVLVAVAAARSHSESLRTVGLTATAIRWCLPIAAALLACACLAL